MSFCYFCVTNFHIITEVGYYDKSLSSHINTVVYDNYQDCIDCIFTPQGEAMVKPLPMSLKHSFKTADSSSNETSEVFRNE